MTWLTVRGIDSGKAIPLRGTVAVPGDKSISHRSLMLGALGEGTSRIEGFLPSGDCLATLSCIRQLGIQVEHPGSGAPTTLLVHGRGLRGLSVPEAPLDCGRSGTTMRLLAGILAGQTFDSILTGDAQLLRRPMRRIADPLKQMGADIEDTNGHGPLKIHGVETLQGGDYHLPVASAQVKSAILLAGLYARDTVTVHQPGPARDHTERMLAAQIEPVDVAGEPIAFDAETVTLDPEAISRLRALNRLIPGDFSSAAFLVAAALLLEASAVTLVGVGVNATRTGLLDVLRAMGADVQLVGKRVQGGEPIADLGVRASRLSGTNVNGHTVVRMIDEFPILAVVATQAEGKTVIQDAAELRVKETDRIATVADELTKLGAQIEPRPDGFVVEGPTELKGAEVDSHGDHRLGMALTVAGLIARGETMVHGAECIPDSFPGFVETMQTLGADVRHGV
ncbi:MAG: 3-phosphoshikimate 1-carboxyvinyltransferase [Anaerolineae bacterium]